jgi:DNA-binding protein HU-beta
MNKGELVNRIAADSNITKAQAQAALNSFIKTTSQSLKRGDKVTLIGFGTFDVNKRNARKGRNPQTGQVINIPAKKVVKFKPGKELSTQVK